MRSPLPHLSASVARTNPSGLIHLNRQAKHWDRQPSSFSKIKRWDWFKVSFIEGVQKIKAFLDPKDVENKTNFCPKYK